MNKKTYYILLATLAILSFSLSETFSQTTQITVTQFIFNPPNPSPGDGVGISLEVKNIGSLRTGEIKIAVESSQISWRSDRTFRNLEPNRSITLNFGRCDIPSNPIHRSIQFQAYRTNGGRSNLANISLECKYSAGKPSGTGITVPAESELLPDLIVSEINISYKGRTMRNEADAFKADITVKNIGTGTAGAFEVTLFVSGPGNSRTFTKKSVKPIEPLIPLATGATKTITFTENELIMMGGPGEWSFKATVDPNNQIRELKEDNNEKTKSINTG